MSLKNDLITAITKVVSGGRMTWVSKNHFSEIALYKDILVQSLYYKIEPMNFKIILDTEHEKKTLVHLKIHKLFSHPPKVWYFTDLKILHIQINYNYECI